MNRNQLIAAAAFALIGSSAFAGGEFDPQTGFGPAVAPASASQVRADTLAARRAGPINVTRDDLMFAGKPAASVSRADVVADLKQARAEGTQLSFDTNTGVEQAFATKGPTRDRADVRAEARAEARASSPRTTRTGS